MAEQYAIEIGGELDRRPLERALLDCFAEITGTAGRIADVGCGPGHVTRYLAARGLDMVGVDLSPRMIEIAKAGNPGVPFEVASMLALPVSDGGWAGAVTFFAIIHLDRDGRRAAYRELARAIRPGGRLLAGFHVSDDESGPGETRHQTREFGSEVDLDVHFLDSAEVIADLGDAGFAFHARIEREPQAAIEYPSRRCYLLAARA